MKKRYLLLLIGIVLVVGLIAARNLSKKQQHAVNGLLARYGLQETVDSKKVLLVGKWKRYHSVQTAVEKAEDGSVIVVFPGTYREAVHASDKKLYILGMDRNECVLTYPNGDYLSPPVEMGGGMLANMTVHATAQEQTQDAIAKAYAMHIDFNSSINSTLDIVDVDFYNDDYQVLGIGLRENFTLRFANCLFECKTDHNAFYCHDDPTCDGSTGQKLIVENCSFVNSGTSKPTILMQSQEAQGSEILCQWTDNTVQNKAGGELFAVTYWNPKVSEAGGWQEMSFWKNSEVSQGNDLKALNEQS